MIHRRSLAAGLGLALLLGSLPAGAQAPQVVRIGVTPGPHAQILEAVKPIAAGRGLDLRPGVGGVRIEDTVVVAAEGPAEPLTDLPRELSRL